jgi:hypothetical protein
MQNQRREYDERKEMNQPAINKRNHRRRNGGIIPTRSRFPQGGGQTQPTLGEKLNFIQECEEIVQAV